MGIDSSADLMFRISADPSNAVGNIALFRSVMTKDLGAMKAEFGDWAKKVFGDLSTVQGAMTGAAAGLVAGAVAAGAALWKAGEHAAEYADKVEEGTDKTGLSAEQMSGLMYAARNAGVGYEELIGSLVKFETVAVKAQKAGSDQANVFARLGISQKDIKAGSENLLPLLYKVADAFREGKSQVEKAAIARELFGRGGANLIEFLQQGAEGMRLFSQRAAELGLVLTEKDLVAAKAFRLEMIQLRAELEGVGLQLGTRVMPAMAGVGVMFTALIETMKKGGAPGPGGWFVRFGIEMETAADDLVKRMRAAIAEAGKTAFGLEPEKPKEATAAWWGFSTMLDQARQRLAALGPEEGKIAAETNHLTMEVIKAGEEFAKLQKEGKIPAETLKREMAAAAAMPGAIMAWQSQALADVNRKRTAAMAAAELELRERLAGYAEESYSRRREQFEREMDLLRMEYDEKKALTKENEALLAAMRQAGLKKIDREEMDEYVGGLKSYHAIMAELLTQAMTSREGLVWDYRKNLAKWDEVAKSLEAAGAGALEIEQMHNTYRSAALERYKGDLQRLVNSEGWQGVFGSKFAEAIRGNEALTREWSESQDRSGMMVRMTLEGLNESAQRAFGQFSNAMGQNIAQAIVYQKTVTGAMRAAVTASLEGLAAESIGYAIYSVALGFLRLAQFMPGSAAQAFQAAALFGSAGVAAAMIGRATAPRQESAGGARATAAGISTGGAVTSPSGASGSASGPRVTVIVNGHIVGRAGIEELTEIINEAVRDRDVRLIATQVKQAQVLNV